MKWDVALRIVGIGGIVLTYGIYAEAGASVTVLFAVLISIVTLISPEAVDQLPFGPNK